MGYYGGDGWGGPYKACVKIVEGRLGGVIACPRGAGVKPYLFG